MTDARMQDYSSFDEELLSTEQSPLLDRPTPCEFITGPAGTGKTFGVVKAVAEDPTYGILAATTGIASVNLGAITVHSLLKYSTTEVLRDHFLSGALTRVLHSLAKRYRRLIVDEISMADAAQLDIWHRSMCEVNSFADVETPMGLTLVGDFCQLPPVRAKWAFDAHCWKHFVDNTVRLTKVWRQDGGPFLDALNLTRRGQGGAAAEMLHAAGAEFHTALDTEFDGTTILPRNDQVGRYNALALDRQPSKAFRVTARRWGVQRPEWGQSQRTHEWGIPPEVELKPGAYVMLLANDPDFEYVNGDCGWINGYVRHNSGMALEVKLVRTGEVVTIPPLIRGVEHTERPDSLPFETLSKEQDGCWHPRPHYRPKVKRWVTGQIEYFPLRLAYASTVHKTQSLTLDRIQVDIRNHFFASPAMVYVALSRCRTLGGLRIVGQREVFARHCRIDERVREWL